ncbi:MAG: DUF2066 domain-containing protein [Gammaproteobacteria bacterium]|nr:DUF2066 domain-containing protein [Gammaproteobacteria bacterium]
MRSLVVTLLCLLCVSTAAAVEVKGLYDVEVPVEDQTRDSRHVAYRTALSEILVRVSGQSEIMMQPEFHAVLDKAYTLVQSYRYRKLNVQEAIEKGLESGLVLWVRLDAERVQRLLREAQRPIWGQVRPGMITWVVIEQGGKRELLGTASSHPAKQLMAQRATLRGMPLQYPLLDLVDQQVVTSSDVWGGFDDPVRTASLRYNNDVILMGRVFSRNNRVWTAEWQLLMPEQTRTWSVQGTDLASLLKPSLDIAVDNVARRFAQSTTLSAADSGYTRVKVWNVNTLEDYARVLQYLQKQISVQEVLPGTISDGTVEFRIRTESSWDNVAKGIALSYLLYPYSPDIAEFERNTDPAAPVIQHYRYLP